MQAYPQIQQFFFGITVAGSVYQYQGGDTPIPLTR